MATMTVPSHVTEESLCDIQIETAKKADTVGEFQRIFTQEAFRVMTYADPEMAEVVQSRIDVITEATKDQTHITLAKTDAGVLGYARVGGGDGGIVLSEQYFGEITTMDDAAQMQHAGAHEQRHGDQVTLNDALVFNGESIDALLLYEGDAELAANSAMNMAATDHRDGQPDAVYAEGQNVAYAMQQVVGTELWNTVMTDTGDVYALQQALDEAGHGQTHIAKTSYQNAPATYEGALAS